MSFTITKSRYYAPDELYSTGSGFQGSEDDLARAEMLFAICSAPQTDGTVYAVELRDNATGTVLAHVGPTMREASASMHAAYSRRQRLAYLLQNRAQYVDRKDKTRKAKIAQMRQFAAVVGFDPAQFIEAL